MKKFLKILGIFLLSVVGLVVAVGFFLPKTYHAERSIKIKAPIAKVFDLVNDLEKNEAWSPWQMNDPSMQITFGALKIGKGASYSWISQNSGSGHLEITDSKPYELIDTTLDFLEQGKAYASWNFKEEPTSHEVEAKWQMKGDVDNFLGRYFALLIDSLIGPAFEQGLEALKQAAENSTI